MFPPVGNHHWAEISDCSSSLVRADRLVAQHQGHLSSIVIAPTKKNIKVGNLKNKRENIIFNILETLLYLFAGW